MKYILIVGTKDAGKSTTIAALCKALNPSSVKSLNIPEKILTDSTLEGIYNNTFLINVAGKNILIVAGAPTEQRYTITVIIEIFVKLKIEITFAIVAMRSYERMDGFSTRTQLQQFGECVLEEQIWRIGGNNYKSTKEWGDRIEKYVGLIGKNL